MKIEITEQIRIKIETSWIGRTPTPSNFSSSAHCHLEHMLVRDDGRSRYMGDRRAMIEGHLIKLIFLLQLQSNLVIRNVLKLVLRNHFPLPIDNLLHKYKEHLALRNNFRVTKKFHITRFDCTRPFQDFQSFRRPCFCSVSNTRVFGKDVMHFAAVLPMKDQFFIFIKQFDSIFFYRKPYLLAYLSCNYKTNTISVGAS